MSHTILDKDNFYLNLFFFFNMTKMCNRTLVSALCWTHMTPSKHVLVFSQLQLLTYLQTYPCTCNELMYFEDVLCSVMLTMLFSFLQHQWKKVQLHRNSKSSRASAG